MQDHAIPPYFWSAPLDEREVRIECMRPLAAVPRLPATEPQPAAHCLPIHREFPRDLSRAFAPLPPRHHLPHQVCAQHLPLRRRSRGCRRQSYSFQALFQGLLHRRVEEALRHRMRQQPRPIAAEAAAADARPARTAPPSSDSTSAAVAIPLPASFLLLHCPALL